MTKKTKKTKQTTNIQKTIKKIPEISKSTIYFSSKTYLSWKNLPDPKNELLVNNQQERTLYIAAKFKHQTLENM